MLRPCVGSLPAAMTTTTATAAAQMPFCHVGTGWADFEDCTGQCIAAGHRTRRRYFSDFFITEDSPACATVQCAVGVVDDATCTSLAGASCDTDGVKFGVAISATSEDAVAAQLLPLRVALAGAVQVRRLMGWERLCVVCWQGGHSVGQRGDNVLPNCCLRPLGCALVLRPSLLVSTRRRHRRFRRCQACLASNCINSFDVESGLDDWDTDDKIIVASQFDVFKVETNSTAVGSGAFAASRASVVRWPLMRDVPRGGGVDPRPPTWLLLLLCSPLDLLGVIVQLFLASRSSRRRLSHRHGRPTMVARRWPVQR